MKKKSIIQVCGIFMLLLPVTTYSKEWTLQDCINYALQHNISLQKTRLQRLTATEDVKGSQAALLPSLSGVVSQNISYNPWPQSGSYTITGSRVQTQVDKVYYNGSYGINANWTVWNKADLAQLTAQRAQDEYAVIQAESALSDYKRQMKQLLQITDQEAFDVVVPTATEEMALQNIPQVTAVYEAALNNRPEIKNAKMGIQYSDMQIKLARACLR